MNILAIESASTICGAALFIDDKLTGIEEINFPRIHSEKLPVFIDKLLNAPKCMSATRTPLLLFT